MACRAGSTEGRKERRADHRCHAYDSGGALGLEAHADGENHCRFPERQDAGLPRNGSQFRGRGRMCRWSSAGLRKGKIGERYLLGAENLTLKQVLDTLPKIT